MKSALAIPGKWVDTNWKITANVAKGLADAGYQGIFRYVPLPNNASAGDISLAEAQIITDAGLQLGLVQHCRRPPVMLALYSGLQDGQAAADAALKAGYPPSCHLFCDLEGAAGNASQVALYLNGWSTAVVGAGFAAGLYVGYSAILSPDQLYALPRFDRYWSDFGPRAVSSRGFCIKQHSPEITIAGVQFDPDEIFPDNFGDLPMVMAA